jgi:hypothetical protein
MFPTTKSPGAIHMAYVIVAAAIVVSFVVAAIIENRHRDVL